MAKKARKATPPARSEKPSGSWPVVLSAAAAAGRTDGGVGLQHHLEEAGFAEKPAMSIIVKRPRPRLDRGRPVDPYVDDVLDALRALCA
jgi:hypothetical protein